jgi:tRNA pseudouridine55 synthase
VVVENPAPPTASAAEIERVLDRFRGPIMQMPPMFSAVKVDGQRLYKLGRKGVEVERESRAITVKELVLEHLEWPCATLRAVCSKGTYVRTLCHDIGAALGPGACMDSLQRLRSGSFSIEDAAQLPALLALTPDQFAARLLPCAPGVAVRPSAPPRRSLLADLNQ